MNNVSAELPRIEREQQIEQEWWGNKPSFRTAQEVAAALASGALKRVEDTVHWRVSLNCPPERRVLAPRALALLKGVGREWAYRFGERRGMNFLVITSLTRPEEYQAELMRDGFSVLNDGSHTRGYAFDISYKWFRKHRPPGERALQEALLYFTERGLANVIDEPHIGIFHVAPSPRYNWTS